MNITGIAIFTNGTHRMVTLKSNLDDDIAIFSKYREICPELAAFMPRPGYCWVGNYSHKQMEAMAAFENGNSKFDLRPLEKSIITI